MYAHPLAKTMEGWWKDHADQASDPEWKKFIDTFDHYLEIKYQEWLSEHTNTINGERVYGMSKTGGCTRASNLHLLDVPREPYSGSTRFTFWLGHVIEVAALATLPMVGYEIESTQGSAELAGIFSSATDGIINLTNRRTIVSVKSTAYKMSGRRFNKGKETWTRRGFAELPFTGFAKANPGHYAQLQVEMAAEDISQGLMLYVSKDIQKVFENDDYLGERGNGSLTFYCELVNFDPEFAQKAIDVHQEQYEKYLEGEAGTPYYLNESFEYVVLPKPGQVDKNNIWGGPNQAVTNKFNPCGGCEVVEACNTYV